eukprot:jgi/Botrbrau1/1573/Bobra.0107s0060.1
MENAALSMSLDDIIKQNSKKTQKTREEERPRAARGNRSFRGGLRRNGRQFDGPRPMQATADSLKVVIDNGIGKGGRRRGGRRFDRGGLALPSINELPRSVGDIEALEGAGKWQHDLFDGEPRQRRSLRDRLAGDPTGATLIVENLAYNVSQEDIHELFDTCGPLRYAELQYDRSGRSEGVAKVVYINPADAKNAFDRYNNVALDGQPMKITIHRGRPQESGRTLSSGIRVEQAARGPRRPFAQNRVASRAFQAASLGRQRGNRNNRPRGNRNTRPARPAGRTKEELDAELDTMMAH